MVATRGRRELWKVEGLELPDSEYKTLPALPVDDPYEANTVTSRIAHREGWHLPALDIDWPCQLIESSPGRHHLYIEKDIAWEPYLAMMKAMQIAGILEPGFVENSEKRGASFLRLRPEEKNRGKR